jgi:hypothetical protein
VPKDNINNRFETDEKQGPQVEATEAPEEVLETLKKGAQLREDLALRLNALKGILDNIEEKAEATPIISNENQVNLSLLQVERSIMIIQAISNDLQHIRQNTYSDPELAKSAEETLLKIAKVYDSVVEKLGK